MTPIDRRLAELAAQAGVTIEEVFLPGRDGDYQHARRLIRLRPGMTARRHRSVLAHELAHCAYGDVPSSSPHVTAKQERRADEWAALRLIDPEQYRLVERLHSGHPGGMALELGVLRSILDAYARVLARGVALTAFRETADTTTAPGGPLAVSVRPGAVGCQRNSL
ncbi:ImmA/IrrE family metallo-endopeptidase [Microbacterium sp. MMO-56]|uniref:ImmA/IrrE family metallo-endopeptidase n=1 Tax=Microbacterium sp. MMO-56 TaxID=3081281 RepID=UPI00301A0939